LSIAVVPAGMAGVRVSQISGTLPETLYPGLHLVIPLVQSVETYDLRDQMFETTMLAGLQERRLAARTNQGGPGIGPGGDGAVPLDPRRLAYIHANLPQPVEKELVPPVVASVSRPDAALPGARAVRHQARRDPARQRPSRSCRSWRPMPSSSKK
jgi:hypothetical protein